MKDLKTSQKFSIFQTNKSIKKGAAFMNKIKKAEETKNKGKDIDEIFGSQ